MAARFDGFTEAQLVRTYTSAKGWRTRKIKTIKNMIQSVEIKLNLSSYNRLQSKLQVLEKQICTMRRDVVEQLLTQDSTLETGS